MNGGPNRTTHATTVDTAAREHAAGVSRRDFLHSTAAATAAAGVAGGLPLPARAAVAGANERIRIGFIGPGGRGFGAHVKSLAQLRAAGAPVDLVAVSEVYKIQEERVCGFIKEQTGVEPKRYVDYRDMLADKDVDAVCIGTPDHWHRLQIVDSLRAGKHVYVEKPMTKTVEEAMDVLKVWRETGRVMQVGVQSTSLPVWDQARGLIDQGMLGKVLGYQTEYFRNSACGQWRSYKLEKEMNPRTIDWPRWLGTGAGLAPAMDFDRAIFAQWRCYWPFGSGMLTDLFVHRTTAMLKATGLRFPARVVGAGGIYLELDTREVPDVATVVADYEEGCQGLITSTMCNENSRIKQVIRGHNGAFEFGNGELFTEFRFIAERPQVTLDSSIRDQTIKTDVTQEDMQKNATTLLHFKNWLHAMQEGRPELCNNTPELGAAAVVTVILGAMSYRHGKVYHFDQATGTYADGSDAWARKWEALSKQRGRPRQVPGWAAGETGSTLHPEPFQSLAGPWIDGRDPAGS
ncbi:MAG: gfo/Idh/MocA family oxidoreductase [Planctomycetia bacterium]|nr:gfo/Idh/MocA family oxidoreductase [Planctomycetia bacterium]